MIAIGATACQPEPAAVPEAPAARPSPFACRQARSALEEERRAIGLLFEDSGTAMVDQASWFRMRDSSREAIIQSLAILVGCSAKQPQRAADVEIRGETGAVLTSRKVSL